MGRRPSVLTTALRYMGSLAAYAVAIALVLAMTPRAHAQNTDTYFYTPGGGGVNGAVGMCLNTSNKAVPCSAANVLPSPVSITPFPGNPATGASATPITASSGNVAAATATATLAASAGKTTYICGFAITSAGSTAAAVVSPTVTNTITGTLTFTYATVAGATLANQPLIVPFTPCVPANAANTTIPVSMPSLGTGNTNTTVDAWGYQY
jgi:hypothetical protein